MNKARRKRLAEVDKSLCAVKEELRDILWDERDALRSMPEAFEDTERYTAIEDAIDHLEDAVDDVSRAINQVHEAMQ